MKEMKAQSNTSISDTYAAVKTYSVSKRRMREALTYWKTLPESWKISGAIETYYLKFWSAEWLHLQTKNEQGILQDSGIYYIIVYATCFTRGKLLKLVADEPETQVKLSFRSAAPEYHLPAYVLIDREI